MLRKILSLANRYGTIQTVTIARELNISKAFACQLLDELERLGYLRAAPISDKISPCLNCPFSSNCLIQHKPYLWIITKRGEQYLSNKKD